MLRVKVVGCGGIGGHLAPNLCQYLHAERRRAHVALIDGDRYEAKNRARMRFARVGDNKAEALAATLAAEWGEVVTVEAVPAYLDAERVRIIEPGDLVLMAVDNHASRKLVDDHCATLDDVTLVSGGNDGVTEDQDGTYGNVQVARRAGGRWVTSSLQRLHPEIRAPKDRLPTDLGCEALATQGAPQLLVTNVAVASAMLNAVLALLRGAPDYEEVYVDVARNRVVPVARAPLTPTSTA
jgi:molybdopterin/thiamine biosynthesis adenylyltransferase